MGHSVELLSGKWEEPVWDYSRKKPRWVKKLLRKVLGYQGYESLLMHRALLPLPRLEPSFFVLGVQKGGTTALHKFLTSLPDVSSAYKKELFFFDQSYHRGKGYYRLLFPLIAQSKEQVVGDFSPSYFPNEAAPERLHQYYPSARLIVMVRSPLERLRSHYGMSKRNGWEEKPFEEALYAEKERLDRARGESELAGFEAVNRFGYLEHSLYGKHLQRWLQVFPLEQFLFVDNESLATAPLQEIARIRRFLSLPELSLDQADPMWQERVFSGGNQSVDDEEIPTAIRSQIRADFEQFERLRKTIEDLDEG